MTNNDNKLCLLCEKQLPISCFSPVNSNSCVDCPDNERVCRCCGYRGVKEQFGGKGAGRYKWLCRSCDNTRRGDYKKTWAGRISYLVRSAKKRAQQKDIEFNLTEEYLHNLIKANNYCCEITGIKLRLADKNNGYLFSGGIYSPSIDRIDNSKGYTDDNVKIVSSAINIMRGQHDIKKFILLCRAVVENNGYFVTKNNPNQELDSGGFYDIDCG